MTINTRKWNRKKWVWFAAILVCVPALMGFYSWSCLTPVYGIFPSACDPKESGCQAAMIDAGVPGDPNGLTEKLLVEAQASSAFSLNRWDQLERCFRDPDPTPGSDTYLIDGDPSLPGKQPFSNCKFGNDVVMCYCYHYFKNSNPADDFNPWLDRFVQYKQCASSADGRSGLIQLGPIFSWGRAVPAYLYNVPFDHPDMIKAFARFWDDFSTRLLQSKLTLPTNEFPRTPEWIISIGNEINHVEAHAQGNGCEQQSVLKESSRSDRDRYREHPCTTVPHLLPWARGSQGHACVSKPIASEYWWSWHTSSRAPPRRPY